MPSTATKPFVALYHADRLRVINPHGDVGLITLWSPWRTVERKLPSEVLDPARSRIAVAANLYGDGMFAMFCNLLYNPQVRHLIALGADLDLPTCDEIDAFLRDGLEETELLGAPLRRVVGTSRTFPVTEGFDAERLRRRLSFRWLGKLSTPGLEETLLATLAELQVADGDEERVRVEIPPALPDDYAFAPSEVAGHQVIRRTPVEAWDELVERTLRFGHPVAVKGGRLELLNAKVVITAPREDDEQALRERGFDLGALHAYQRRMFDPDLAGADYTYGNRLGEHFGLDTLDVAIERLRANEESRDAYISLWDTPYDLPGDHSNPCLVTLFFRRSQGALTLTATYRAHNLLTAWLLNVYGLLAIQRHVAAAVEMPIGPITVISHSLGADPASDRYPAAAARVGRPRGGLDEDPNGYFVVSLDGDEILAEHRFEGALIKQYRSDRADRIAHAIAADMAVSLPSHGLWLGRELAAKEQLLRARRTDQH
ncbi:thymidylate synthase [Solirubrobacter soli]|uniref:thymidylate synthase n=1 Tax=Solirubrobacter soli TaxID=363832 RepID=UPI0004891C34|nr:thymidylate synthase [Solirubrobacter soli]